MDLKLSGSKAFISGSTGGIGFAIARLLAVEGAEVILNGRDEKRLQKAQSTILSNTPGAKVSGIVADFGDVSSVNQLITQLGEIDILINNVGIFTSQSFEDTSDDNWYRLFEVNVMSGVRLSRALLPGMLKRNKGRVLFVSSECAALVPSDLIAYSMTKAALLNISRGLAQITKGTEVTVNAIIPGSTLSEGVERFLEDQASREGVSKETVEKNFFTEVRTTSLLGRFAHVDEVANAAVYLSSPLAAATNGAGIKVDGGSIPGMI